MRRGTNGKKRMSIDKKRDKEKIWPPKFLKRLFVENKHSVTIL